LRQRQQQSRHFTFSDLQHSKAQIILYKSLWFHCLFTNSRGKIQDCVLLHKLGILSKGRRQVCSRAHGLQAVHAHCVCICFSWSWGPHCAAFWQLGRYRKQ
jgi:hypothetical protein